MGSSDAIDRMSGVIFGQIIGDALGTRYEFKKSDEVKQMIKKDMKNNFLNILGGGPFKLIPGQITDDSELALGLFHSILENKNYDKYDVAKKYIKWYKSGPFDIGNTTRNALFNANTYDDLVRNSNIFNKDSKSNGCLMRVSSIGLLGTKLKDEQMLKYCIEDCIMTNPNMISIDAVRVYCMAIKTAILTGNRKWTYEKAYNTAKTNFIKRILTEALEKPCPTILENGQYINPDSKYMGFCGVALQNAFYELIHGKTFYDSMINIISKGGDTDTNACIGGALLGAIYGKKQIPTLWINSIKMINPRIYKYKECDQQKLDNLIELFIHQC